MRRDAFPHISLASFCLFGGEAGRNIPVRTNWPTVAENPDKKALNGYHHHHHHHIISPLFSGNRKWEAKKELT